MPALASSARKMLYVIDEGLTADVIFPADWKQIAKDAYNGLPLCKRDVKGWENHQ